MGGWREEVKGGGKREEGKGYGWDEEGGRRRWEDKGRRGGVVGRRVKLLQITLDLLQFLVLPARKWPNKPRSTTLS